MKLLVYSAVVLVYVLALPGAWGQRATDLSGMDLEPLMQIRVEAASLHAQKTENAPASVTIITQD